MKKHFLIKYHYQSKAQKWDKDISDAIYIVEISNFTIETYYGIFTNAFNDLSNAILFTPLHKNRELLSLKVFLKKNIP